MSVQFRFEYMFNESCWQWQPATAETEQITDQVTTGGHVPQYWKQPPWWVACTMQMMEYMGPANHELKDRFEFYIA